MDDRDSPWFDDEDGLARGDGRRRIRLLLAAATVPWLVVVLLVVRQAGEVPEPVGETAADPVAADEPPQPAAVATDDADEATDPVEVLSLTEIRGDWRMGVGDGDVAAVAVLVARAWLTGVDPILPINGFDPYPDGYAEHLVVEAIERPDAGAAIVTLTAIVLEPDANGLAATPRRLAVPLMLDDGVHPAGEPWWLPEPVLEPVTVELEPVSDPEEQLAAAEALTAAGYLDVELLTLGNADGWPWIAQVRARTPGGAVVEGPVWLRRHLHGFVVVGTPLPDTVTRPVDAAEAGP